MQVFDKELMELDYIRFLSGLVCMNRFHGKSYILLARRLAEKQFYTIVNRDENRAEDAKKLRFLFLSGARPENVPDGPCSMLELLVSLAMKMEEIMQGDGDRIVTTKFFFEILDNAGLFMYDDDFIFDGIGEGRNSSEEIDAILESVIERRYSYTGEGGLFPLRGEHGNQRNAELWYQMQYYLQESHPDL